VIRRTMFVLAVPDLSRAAAFYRDVLGFEIRECANSDCARSMGIES